MLDITLSNFESDVIEASRRQPVLLDIWAPWCGPCKALGPVLEKLEAAYAGRFMLAKLNSDEQPEIAGQLSGMFGVRSIPFCVLFQRGEPVDGFVGALPEGELRVFLDKHVPVAEVATGADDADRAREMLSSGRVDDAIAVLRDSLERDPSNDQLRFDCLRALIRARRVEEARTLYAPVAGRGNPATDDVAAAGLWLEACALPDEGAGNAGEILDERFRRAQACMARSQFTAALDELLEILTRDKDWGGGKARTAYLAILRLLRADERLAATESVTPALHGGMLQSPASMSKRRSDADAYHRRLSMALF